MREYYCFIYTVSLYEISYNFTVKTLKTHFLTFPNFYLWFLCYFLWYLGLMFFVLKKVNYFMQINVIFHQVQMHCFIQNMPCASRGTFSRSKTAPGIRRIDFDHVTRYGCAINIGQSKSAERFRETSISSLCVFT